MCVKIFADMQKYEVGWITPPARGHFDMFLRRSLSRVKYFVLGITVENFRPIGFLFLEICFVKDFVKIGQIEKLREKKLMFILPPFPEKAIFLNFVKSNNTTIPSTFKLFLN